MKYIIFVLLAFLLGCGSIILDQAIYTADTAKRSKCTHVMVGKDHFPWELTDKLLKDTEDQTGYSECTHKYLDKDTYLLECKKPMPYKQLTSNKIANCQKFMADNNLN
jgi:hypothetical protein